jgi:hypothetical protein
MKHFIISGFLIFAFLNGFASQQESVVKGRIYELSTGQGLQGANVLFKSTKGVIAGVNGNYIIKTSQGEITVTVQHIGFQTVSKTIRINEKDTFLLDFGLTPEVAEIDQIVVSADRLEQRISELSVSIRTISPIRKN